MTVPWRGPPDLKIYDQTNSLSEDERAALERVVKRLASGGRAGPPPRADRTQIARIVRPLNDLLTLAGARSRTRYGAIGMVLQRVHRYGRLYWSWTRDEWRELIEASDSIRRQHLLACAYWLGGQRDLHADLRLSGLFRYALACKVFGREPVDEAINEVAGVYRQWGSGPSLDRTLLPRAVSELLLRSGTPRLSGITREVVAETRESGLPRMVRRRVDRVVVALEEMRLLALPSTTTRPPDPGGDLPAMAADVPLEWTRWCQRWQATSILSPLARKTVYGFVLQAGRWLAAMHPEILSPQQWTRELCAEYVAAVDRMRVGDWSHSPLNPGLRKRVGRPLMPRSKVNHLRCMARFLQDCQEWGWASLQFDVRRALRTPRAIQALIGPDPRVIADHVWAKLLSAGINLTAADIPRHPRTNVHWYPPLMLRALAITWLFAGLRSAELLRLRVGCVRWQREDVVVHGTTEMLPQDAVCWLHVPVNKTSTAFTKAVDRLVGESIGAWEAARLPQPVFVDEKTGEAVHLLFAYRGKRIGKHYLNHVLIPLLCRKAGVPVEDARGRITGHRARSTIATQLYNSKEPMNLFELKEWLGHHSVESTEQYAKIAPTKLAKAYEAAGYFQRNLRMIEVLVDRDAVTSGAAAAGKPWRFYDLGHGYCTYDFFEQCPHRMACAKCSFYAPKASSHAALLEGKANLLQMRQEIPLTDEEAAAVDDGVQALDVLCNRLAEIPTPAGPTPKELRDEGKDE